jgi:hypothetical protein
LCLKFAYLLLEIAGGFSFDSSRSVWIVRCDERSQQQRRWQHPPQQLADDTEFRFGWHQVRGASYLRWRTFSVSSGEQTTSNRRLAACQVNVIAQAQRFSAKFEAHLSRGSAAKVGTPTCPLLVFSFPSHLRRSRERLVTCSVSMVHQNAFFLDDMENIGMIRCNQLGTWSVTERGNLC